MIGALLHARAARRMRAVGRHACERQEQTLMRLVREAERTRFGREHGFAEIGNAADFRLRVPLREYADLLPWLERARDGARDELWPGAPVAFAMTSGTTGQGRFFPHTSASLDHAMAGCVDALFAYVVRAGDRSLPAGRIGFLGGPLATERFPSGMPRGANSGILAARAPLWLRPFRVPSARVLSMEEPEERLAETARELARTDVRLLVATPAGGLLLLEAIEREAGATVRDAWPSWRGLIHGGMAFAPYADAYRRRAGEGIAFVDVYAATEGGVLAVQDRDGDPSLALLADRGVYYEFTPADDPAGERVGLSDVEAGRMYVVTVTTAQGLWAYRLGDLVRFTEVDPPRIRVCGRQRLFLNAFGERLTEEQLDRAVAEAGRACGGEVLEYAVLPEAPDRHRPRGRHLWLLEFSRLPGDLAAFARALDASLKRDNGEYRARRAGDAELAPPAVRLLHRGTFAEWMRRRRAPGMQARPPRILDAELARALGEAATSPGSR